MLKKGVVGAFYNWRCVLTSSFVTYRVLVGYWPNTCQILSLDSVPVMCWSRCAFLSPNLYLCVGTKSLYIPHHQWYFFIHSYSAIFLLLLCSSLFFSVDTVTQQIQVWLLYLMHQDIYFFVSFIFPVFLCHSVLVLTLQPSFLISFKEVVTSLEVCRVYIVVHIPRTQQLRPVALVSHGTDAVSREALLCWWQPGSPWTFRYLR